MKKKIDKTIETIQNRLLECNILMRYWRLENLIVIWKALILLMSKLLLFLSLNSFVQLLLMLILIMLVLLKTWVWVVSLSPPDDADSCQFHYLPNSPSKSGNSQVDQDLLVYVEELLNCSICLMNKGLVLQSQAIQYITQFKSPKSNCDSMMYIIVIKSEKSCQLYQLIW